MALPPGVTKSFSTAVSAQPIYLLGGGSKFLAAVSGICGCTAAVISICSSQLWFLFLLRERQAVKFSHRFKYLLQKYEKTTSINTVYKIRYGFPYLNEFTSQA